MQADAKAVLESLATAVLLTDHTLKIVYANSAAEQLFSMSRSKLTAYKLTDLLDKGQKSLLESIQLALKPHAQGFNASSIEIIPEPHQSIRTDIYVSHYSGKGRGLIVEFRALDYQQKINQEMARRSQHLAARDLIRSLAHEIKNPLGGIRGAAQLLEMTYGRQEHLTDYTQVIIEQADRLKSLVDRLLGPQRPNPLTLCNIHYVIEKVLSLENMALKTQMPIRFIKDYDPSIPEIMLDVDAMQQAVLNIISNAVHALSEAHIHHPQITIQTRAQLGSRLINGIKYPSALITSISDNGPGIPENIRETLFYPMVTSRPDGSGLGLSIAQSIVERHNGLIECDSEPGRTVFRIVLPLRKENLKGRED